MSLNSRLKGLLGPESRVIKKSLWLEQILWRALTGRRHCLFLFCFGGGGVEFRGEDFGTPGILTPKDGPEALLVGGCIENNQTRKNVDAGGSYQPVKGWR